MKTIKILSILVSFFPAIISAQTTFAPAGASWHYHGESSPTAGPGTRYCLSEVEKDTILAGRSCTKMITTCYNHHPGTNAYNDTAIMPAFYTYTSGDTVFYYNEEFGNFYPLYRFDVLSGDTVSYHIPTAAFSSSDSLFRVRVDSVTTLTVSGTALKKVWTSPLDDFWFHGPYAERLGALAGAELMAHEYTAGIPGSQGLRCYADGLLSYSESPAPCDFLTTGIEKIASPEGCSVYPNPITDRVFISMDIKGQWKIQITDALGRLKYYDVYTAGSGIPYIIHTQDLVPGIYYMILQCDEASFVKKMVKLH